MEDLFQSRKISRRDLGAVYESLFLRAVTSFEAFLEDLFMAILQNRARYHKTREVAVRMTTTSRQALLEILFGNNDYLDWLPFHRTEKRARLYLDKGKPFTDLEDSHRSTIKTITTIRHAIAHRSDYAMAEFKRTVIASRARTLMRGDRSPAGFLQSHATSTPSANMFQVYVGELGRIAQILC